jgi:hypothetical protein
MKPFGPVENGSQVLFGLDYPHGGVARHRGKPVPHRSRLLALGRGRQSGVPRTSNYKCTVTVNEDGTWAYDECTTVEHARFGAVVQHTDRNLMRRVG